MTSKMHVIQLIHYLTHPLTDKCFHPPPIATSHSSPPGLLGVTPPLLARTPFTPLHSSTTAHRSPVSPQLTLLTLLQTCPQQVPSGNCTDNPLLIHSLQLVSTAHSPALPPSTHLNFVAGSGLLSCIHTWPAGLPSATPCLRYTWPSLLTSHTFPSAPTVTPWNRVSLLTWLHPTPAGQSLVTPILYRASPFVATAQHLISPPSPQV